jgi:uncharacterized membrane protein
MSEKVIDAMGSIRFGWNTLKANLKFFVILMAIVGIVDLLIQLVSVGLPSNENNMGFLSILAIFVFIIVYVIITVIFEVGLIRISIMFRNGEKPQIRNLYRSNPIVLMNYLVASCVYLLMILFGLLLLVVPGIYLILKYQFYDYLIIDRGMGPFEALKESGRMTDGAKTGLFMFWLTLYGGILAVMVFLVVLLIALPAVSIMAVYSQDFMSIFSIFIIIFVLVESIFSLVVISPITMLARADIYKTLLARLTASTASPAPALATEVV